MTADVCDARPWTFYIMWNIHIGMRNREKHERKKERKMTLQCTFSTHETQHGILFLYIFERRKRRRRNTRTYKENILSTVNCARWYGMLFLVFYLYKCVFSIVFNFFPLFCFCCSLTFCLHFCVNAQYISLHLLISVSQIYTIHTHSHSGGGGWAWALN